MKPYQLQLIRYFPGTRAVSCQSFLELLIPVKRKVIALETVLEQHMPKYIGEVSTIQIEIWLKQLG